VLTVDLFLDIDPFTSIKSNKYGSNINIRDLVSCRPFKVLVGQEKELFGFDDFNPNNILDTKNDWLVGEGYPAMVQCLVLRKPATLG